MSQSAPAASGYGDTYDIYRALNWTGILPLRPYTKWPPPDGYTGHDGIYPSFADMYTWAQDRPDDNLVLRLTDDMIGIDVDDYGEKNGGKTLAEAEKRWGALPPTYRSTSRDDGVSGIRLFKVPAGTAFPGKLEFEVDGVELGGIEIIQRHHRYVLCWPSHHDKTKKPYRWFDEAAGLATMNIPPAPANLPDLPQRWIDELSVTGHNGVDLGDAPYDIEQSLTDGEPSAKVAESLNEALTELTAGNSRHDSVLARVLGLLRHGKNGEDGVKSALAMLGAAFISTVTADRSRTAREASDEFGRMLYGERGRRLLAEDWWWPVPVAAPASVGPAPAPKLAAAVLSVEHLEQDFWEPAALKQIYEDALGRMLSPWAVLTHCVARVLNRVRPCVVLPPIIGYGSLNWFGAIVSASGGGKTAAENRAAELVFPGMSNIRNPGSGEGVAAQYWTKGTKKNPPQRLEAMMFYADEVDCVRALAKREGSNLMSVVRTGFSGGTLGFSYTKGNDLHVQAGTYRLTLVLSIQPARSGWLFEDADGGTPQRLMWFPGDDPRISDSVKERGKAIKLTIDLGANDWQKYPRELVIADEARKLIRSVRAQTARGETAALDGHALFSREKFAFALALLCGRTEMTLEGWRRSGIAADVSSYTRDWTQQVERTSGVNRAAAGGALRGVAQDAADDERVKRRVLRWALRTLNEAPGKQNKQTGRDHPWLLAALALGASSGLVAVTADGEWKLP
jgi:hypothetical protein